MIFKDAPTPLKGGGGAEEKVGGAKEKKTGGVEGQRGRGVIEYGGEYGK